MIQAIKEMETEGAHAVMVISTCVPEVIGEDIEGIINEIQPKTDVRLNYVQMPHFKCNSYPSGFWKTLEAFGGMMEPLKRNAQNVNVLGRSGEEDHIPMPELLLALEKRNIMLRYLAPKSDIKDFISAPDAALNLVLSPYMNPLAKYMQERFGVPFVSMHEVYDVSGIDRLHTDIAQILGITWGDDFNCHKETASSLEIVTEKKVNNLSYVTTHRNTLMVLPLALYLKKLGMEPLLLHIEEFYPDDKTWSKELLEKEVNPYICHMVNEVSDAVVLEGICPDVSFGEIPGGKNEIPCVTHLSQLYGQIGYERTEMLLKWLIEAVTRQESKRR